jgi:hypothetical protein
MRPRSAQPALPRRPIRYVPVDRDRGIGASDAWRRAHHAGSRIRQDGGHVASKKTVEARKTLVVRKSAAQKRASAARKPKPTTRAAVRAPGHADGAKRVEVQNVNHPGARRSVAAAPYLAMRRAMLEVLPRQAPGLTLVALARAIGPRLPPSIFPGGAKAGWWLKAVQLDLEAKRVIVRDGGSPLRLRRA